jgi:hypothetical protein
LIGFSLLGFFSEKRRRLKKPPEAKRFYPCRRQLKRFYPCGAYLEKAQA